MKPETAAAITAAHNSVLAHMAAELEAVRARAKTVGLLDRFEVAWSNEATRSRSTVEPPLKPDVVLRIVLAQSVEI